ncbi:hypothetical protein [Opitutus terrae]|uniref:Uncharacterized protein n=1 Tax=Opitutus terrae (strain DSM 11246 / JCM 15787 / PB90-1) TaxID=452637 RepID=B1ZR45_OPITP|nr:hypothetical protein [Opitutus terrae]ACB73712.1 hypothetical protein Oter_0422 [Opitutus terrae PB90-1]
MLQLTIRCQLRHEHRRLSRCTLPKLPMQRLTDRSRPPSGPERTLARLARLRSDA